MSTNFYRSCTECNAPLDSMRIQSTCNACSISNVPTTHLRAKGRPVPNFKMGVSRPPSVKMDANYYNRMWEQLNGIQNDLDELTTGKTEPKEQLEQLKNIQNDIDELTSVTAGKKKPTEHLKLFEVTVYPHAATSIEDRTSHVLVLAKGFDSAERHALKVLGMADPGGRLKIHVREIEGPFADGSILSVKET